MSLGRPTGQPAAAPVAGAPPVDAGKAPPGTAPDAHGPAADALPRWPWLAAARPQTLAVGVAPVVLATALAWAAGGVCLPVLACALGGSVCIQVGTNLFNDWADAARGADAPDRLGPVRVTQRGLLPARHVWWASVACFAAACAQGVVLLGYGGWRVLAVGVLSVVAGVLYTGGPAPLAYVGLGEPFAFVFFGPVPVITTYALHGHRPNAAVVGLSLSLGAFSAAVLVVNNLRDRTGDARVGKNTLAVRLGPKPTRALYAALVCGAYAVAASLAASAWAAGRTPWAAACLLSAPWAARAVNQVRERDGAALNASLGATARLELAFATLAAVGAVVARLAAVEGVR